MAAAAKPASGWPKWGTPIAGQAPDASLAHGIGSIFKAGSQAEQIAAETENFPLRIIWFATAQQAEAYAQRAYPKAFANWQKAQVQSIPQQVAGNLGTGTGLFAVGHWLGSIVTHLTDIHMWISLGWLALGFALIWIGVLTWLRVPQIAAGLATSAVARRI